MTRADALLGQGSVFGFDVHSTLAWTSLRAGGSGDRLEVVARSEGGTIPGDQMVAEIRQPHFLARIYHDGSTYRIWVRSVGWFDVDPQARRISIPPTSDAVQREELLWGFLQRGDLSLHAAAVEVDGEAIVLVAPQAQGKSTLAAGFAQLGYRILSEDLTCVRCDGRPSVIPGPATLRLRNDVASGVRVDFGRRLGGAHDRARYALDAGSRGDCRPVPIAGLFLLRPSEGETRLEPVPQMRALPDLWQSSFRLTSTHERACFHHFVDLVSVVPIFNLYRPLRVDALRPTVHHVLARLRLESPVGTRATAAC